MSILTDRDRLRVKDRPARAHIQCAKPGAVQDEPSNGSIDNGYCATQRGETEMRFIVMVRATSQSESGVLPDQKLLADMGKFNEELVKAGVMLAGEGLQPSAKGARVRFSGDKRTVIDGPFAETNELIAGFWIFKVKSKQEAIDWVKRAPNPFPGVESDIEIRQIFEAEDFGEQFTPELRQAEERMRQTIDARK